MVFAQLISSYRNIILQDGILTKDELIEALKLEDELAPEYKTAENLSEIADKILFKESKEKKERYKCKNEKMEERLSLYNQGYNDYEIADFQLVSQSTVMLWRKRNGLVKNPQKKKPIYIKRMKYRMELYEKGYNDRIIADMTNVSSTTIYMWRKKHNLPSKNKRPMKKNRMIKNV